MPQFILFCRDKPGALALRQKTRPAHLEYANKLGAALLLAGPMLDESGNPVGSLLIVEAEDHGAASALAAADPYAVAGLFAETRITPFRTVIENFPKA